MIIGLLTITLSVPGSDSLKDKRQVVKSLLDIVRGKFNVSAAEIDHLNSHTQAGLAFVCVSNDKVFVNQVLDKVLYHAESNPLCEVLESHLEFI